MDSLLEISDCGESFEFVVCLRIGVRHLFASASARSCPLAVAFSSLALTSVVGIGETGFEAEVFFFRDPIGVDNLEEKKRKEKFQNTPQQLHASFACTTRQSSFWAVRSVLAVA